MDVYGVCTTVSVALPRTLATMIRRWARAYASEDLLTSLTALENAIRTQSANAEAVDLLRVDADKGLAESSPEMCAAGRDRLGSAADLEHAWRPWVN